MASFGRSFKPSHLSPRIMRPGKPRRTLSSSSDLSSVSSSSRADEPFVFSAGNTPGNENAPTLPSKNATAAPAIHRQQQAGQHAPTTDNVRPRLDTSETPGRSRPITIELPVVRRRDTGTVVTPLERPLSARGDIPGAYFPLHEDPKTRVHRPHPFHLDVTNTRHRSASQGTSLASQQQHDFHSAAAMSFSAQSNASNLSNSLGGSAAHTSVSSYLPSGVHGHGLPVGKYYPSNYENRPRGGSRSGNSNSQQLRPSTGSWANHQFSSTVKAAESSSAAPKPALMSSSHTRTESDAKRRLQQYQRDMIAQTALAARQVLGRADASNAVSLAANASLQGAPVKIMQLGGTVIGGVNPAAPKLEPLGSPGPVTPMELEGGESVGYLGLAVAETAHQGEELARAVRADQRRQRKEAGSSSPSVSVDSV